MVCQMSKVDFSESDKWLPSLLGPDLDLLHGIISRIHTVSNTATLIFVWSLTCNNATNLFSYTKLLPGVVVGHALQLHAV
jgi:hypothetical protein